MSDIDAHLLIVDDDQRIRALLAQFLLRNGFLVSTARDAAHARRLLAGLEFDLIVLDVMMAIRHHAKIRPYSGTLSLQAQMPSKPMHQLHSQ